MSETRYTPKDYRDMAQEVCDEYKTTKAETDPIAAMLRQAATDAEALAEAQAKVAALSVRRCGCGHYADEHDGGGRYKCVYPACKCTGFVPSPMTMVFIGAQRQERKANAEALAAKEQEIARLTAEHARAILRLGTEQRTTAELMVDLTTAETALTAERQKVRALREWLAFTDYPTGWRITVTTDAAQHHADCSWRHGMLCDCAAITMAEEARKDVLAKLDALGLTGDATEGQG